MLALAGATPGPVFGAMSDKSWYQAILAKDDGPFRDVVDRAVCSVDTASSVTVVADAVDGYNPVHDLTAAIGEAVAAQLKGRAANVSFLASAAVPGVAGKISVDVTLDDAAQGRKRAAVAAYAPLAEEARRIFEEAPESFGREVLIQQDFDWPDDFEPHWETFARERVASGRYVDPITYRSHVLPVARAILGRE